MFAIYLFCYLCRSIYSTKNRIFSQITFLISRISSKVQTSAKKSNIKALKKNKTNIVFDLRYIFTTCYLKIFMYKNMYDYKSLLENDLQLFDKKKFKKWYPISANRTTKVYLLPQIIEHKVVNYLYITCDRAIVVVIVW